MAERKGRSAPKADARSTPVSVSATLAEKSTVKKSAAKPAAKEPAAKKPAVKKSAAKPAAKKPAAKKPAVKKSAAKPAAKKPAAMKPAAKKPAALTPAAKNTAATKPAATKPTEKIPAAPEATSSPPVRESATAARKKAPSKASLAKAKKDKSVLVIVESPAKAKTIEKYLGSRYTVLASMGHLIDLPKSRVGIDVEGDFEPEYLTIRGKAKLLKELQKAAKKSGLVLLASDNDREGEAISYHIQNAIRGSPSSE
jgi:hypothetical protein